jgi:hypothetical protein
MIVHLRMQLLDSFLIGIARHTACDTPRVIFASLKRAHRNVANEVARRMLPGSGNFYRFGRGLKDTQDLRKGLG